LGQTQVVTGPAATVADSAQRFGHTQGMIWTTGAATLEQVLGHTQGRTWAVAGVGAAVRSVARIRVIELAPVRVGFGKG
jgi:hypothetical protein